MKSLLQETTCVTTTDTHNTPQLNQLLYQTYPELEGDDYQWNKLLLESELISVPTNTLLMQPDSPCAFFMLLIKGSVRVYQQTPNDREVTLYRTHGGDLCVLSINGLMQHKNFGAFAKTETDITALSLTREQFMKAMAVYEPFREFILISLTSRFHNVLELLEETVFESLDTRLLCLLSRLSKEQNRHKIKITHQELARELGTSREVISRLLKAIERQGCIALNRGEIHIFM